MRTFLLRDRVEFKLKRECPRKEKNMSRNENFQILEKEEDDKLFSWKEYIYDYMDYPLIFVQLSSLTPHQKMYLLKIFDEAYGNTDEDTDHWALEYQVLTRMLLHESALIVNPYFVDITDRRLLIKIGDCIGEANSKKFLRYNGLSEENAHKLYLEEFGVPEEKIWKVPAYWESYGFYYVKASSFEEAASFIENASNVPLPETKEFIDSSFTVDFDAQDIYNNSKGAKLHIGEEMDVIYHATHEPAGGEQSE